MFMEWYLVFWLANPANSTEYAEYSTERACRDAEYVWNRRLQAVGSEIRAECRRRTEQ